MAMTGEHRGAASRHLRTVLSAGAVGSLTDGRLLERFLAGRGDDDSASAFAALVERHGPMVLGVCRNALDNLHDAEDAAQATFLILAKRGGSIRRVESLASWLFGVALKVASRERARAARRRAIEQRGAEMKARVDGSEMSPETRSELYAELDRLPERFRAPIVLCHLEGLSNEQAAGQLGLPVRTVQRRLAQGRERLKGRLMRRGIVPAASLGTLAIGTVAEAASASWIEATVRAAAGLAAGRAVGVVASVPVAALMQGAMGLMLVARLKAIAAGVFFAGVVVALAGAGALIAARRQAQPVGSESRGDRSEPPAVTQIGPWIKGIVVDERGRPVAGARVSSLWSIDAKPVTTKADGTFSLPTNEPRLTNQSILATVDGGARQGVFRFDGPTGFKGPRTLPRVVIRPALDVTVTVVDGRGTPVPDAAVFVLDLVFPVAEARTDARGVAVLRVPPDAMTQWIVGGKPGVGFDYFENYRSVPAIPWTPPPRSARLVLDGARTVRVRAVDSAGRPVPGVEFYPLTIMKKRKLRPINLSPISIDPRTDANGIATFDWLPADLQGGMGFYSASPSYDLPEPPDLDPAKPDVELTARVVRPARASGKVTLPDGSPASGILVEAQGVGGTRLLAGSSRARTAADGSYTMDLPPEQSYMISVIDDEWTARSLGGIVIREGVPQTGLDLSLERGAVIRGRVTAGPASKPAPGRTVLLTERRGPAVPPGMFKDQPPNPVFNALVRISDTDEDGRYSFRVAPGEYQLTGPRVPGDRSDPSTVTIAAGQEVERDFHLPRDDRPWKTIRGVVRANDAGGATIADAVMVVQPIEVREPPAHGYADDQGRFVLPRLSGIVVVYARSPEGHLAGHVVVGEHDDRDITIEARPSATARGRVVDENGKPWPSVNVFYSVEVGLPAVGRDGPPGVGQSVLTDDDGRFSATGLPAGTMCSFLAYGIPGGGSSKTRLVKVKDTQPFDVPPLVINRPRPAATKPGPE